MVTRAVIFAKMVTTRMSQGLLASMPHAGLISVKSVSRKVLSYVTHARKDIK